MLLAQNQPATGSPANGSKVPESTSSAPTVPDGAAAQPANSQSQSPTGTFLTPRTAKSGNLAAAEAEDDTSVYRHSPSVRAVGRWFHLDEEQASRTFEYFNFALLAGTLLFFLFKKMPAVLRSRRQEIQKHLLDARTATEEASARLKAVEERFARLDQDIATIRKQAEEEGAAEEERIKTLIEKERLRIITSAEQEIAAAGSSARRELMRFAAGLAVDRASSLISLNVEDDRALIRQFVAEIGAGTHGGGQN
jgi:F-type H+-transporting ATPase subunit b